jgi:hypothetical protein
VSQPFEEGTALASISYAIPLSTPFKSSFESGTQFVLLGKGEEETEDCPGTVFKPEAAPGRACIYTLEATSETELAAAYPSTTSGAFLLLTTPPAGGKAYGTWAITAP